MNSLSITGGTPLKGTITASGAKNAMTKLLVASMLSDKKCIFYNVPEIGDVKITIELCKEIGMNVVWDKKNKSMEVITKNLKTTKISHNLSGANRIPILIIGALLGRTNEEINVPTLGGDKLGKRPLDFHIKALKLLGAKIEFIKDGSSSMYCAHAKNGLTGTIINLSYPSVGATENTILASVKAKGITVIKNAAIEPEIIDLILFLQKIGVDITIEVDRTIIIRETKVFYEAEHTVLSDRNEIASYAIAAISTKGDVFIEKADHHNMISFLNKLREINAGFTVKENGIRFFYQGPLKGGIHIETDVHPGFMTDWQPLFGVLLTQCEGLSIVHETVYENRFGYTEILKEMGAEINLFTKCLGEKYCRFAKLNHHHSIIVKGKTALRSKNISIPDLRAGFAYIMAALLAEDTSIIEGKHYLERGYEHFEKKLLHLGANISSKPNQDDFLEKFYKLSKADS